MAEQSNGNKYGLGNKLSHRHEAIIQWMIHNPDRPLQECAAYFGVGATWLSCIIHSDAFQERLAQQQEKVFSETTLHLKKKLEATAHVGVEKLGQYIAESSDPKFVAEATDKILHRLGYAPSQGARSHAGPTNIQNNTVVMADPAQLAQARELMARAQALRLAPTADAGESGESSGASLSPPLGVPKEPQSTRGTEDELRGSSDES